MDHVVVQRWLRQVLEPYRDPQRTFVDIDAALVAVSSLSPRTEAFTYNDGRTQLLVTLSGTIPIGYRGATYNIPVQLWIPKEYPASPPIAFVVPTSDMLVRKGPNVDPSGQISGSYLARWETKHEACSLLDLIRDCQQMFAQEPPVYAKPRNQAQTSAPSTSASPSPGPSTAGAASPVSPSQRGAPWDRPPPPPPMPLPGHTPSAGADHAPSQAESPLRPPKPPTAHPYQPLPFGSFTSQQGGQQAPHFVNGHRSSQSFSQQPGPPPPLPGPQQYHQQPSRSSSGDFGRDGSFSPPSSRHQGPGRSSSLHVTSASVGMSPLGHPGGGSGAPMDGTYAQHRQSWDGRPPPPPQPQQHDDRPPYHAQQPRLQHPAAQSPLQHPGPQFSQGTPQEQQGRAYVVQSPQQPQQYTYQTASPAPGMLAQYGGAHGLRQHDQQSAPPPPAPPPGGRLPPAQGPAVNAQQAVPPPKPRAANIMDALDGDGDDRGAVGAETMASSSSNPSGATGTGAPPPPRPPNPELLDMHARLLEKIETRLSSLSASLEQSNQHLQVLSSDLDRGRPAIEDEMRRLEAVRDVCRATGDRLEQTTVEAQKRIEMLRSREDPDVDDMVLATSIVGNQLLDLVAEDNAIEDCMYQLGRALNAERIELDRFLKQTRMLAREQFMKRALAHKIVEGMGWQT